MCNNSLQLFQCSSDLRTTYYQVISSYSTKKKTKATCNESRRQLSRKTLFLFILSYPQGPPPIDQYFFLGRIPVKGYNYSESCLMMAKVYDDNLLMSSSLKIFPDHVFIKARLEALT